MAELTKFGASEVTFHIKHDLREIPNGKEYRNEAIDPELSKRNYSLLRGRCQTASEANQYRKDLEKEIYKYNRKNLVHAVEIAVQCPNDCPPEQKEAFFRETYNYICSTLPMGERCVFVAQVHVDERHYSPTGEMISKDHLHVMYVPAVKDAKHKGFEYRLCADQLTKKARLKEFHPGLQKHLDKAGIKATVYRKKEGAGKSISLSVAQLKELTAKTGITIDHQLTVDELANIINSNILAEKQTHFFKLELSKKEEQIEMLSADVAAKDAALQKAHTIIKETTSEHDHMQDGLGKKDHELSEAMQSLRERDAELTAAQRQNIQLEQRIAELEKELSQSRAHEQELSLKVDQLESKSQTTEITKKEQIWGHTAGWGTHATGWGHRETDSSSKYKDYSEEVDI